MPNLQERLRQDIADISWQDLLPHAKRDAIIVVKEELDLSEVGMAIAEDNTVSVKTWITKQSISKPTADQLANWNKEPQKQFTTLIVQPFVIVKEVKN
ncbi:DUF2288 domain-containing protein [Pleurocapsa sp. PCC 7319]|uniref:DUF2288 domain-containing protein n=1 Tax=Pleurocapsa sp. PCC 7319 TaxID=118161 RepID=UPI00034B13BB|nr:DUF2288 domain-containing protein [Pleurocapsa sp. PCC 7319]